MRREFRDEEGNAWVAVAVDAVVAHGKAGAALAFLPADAAEGEPLRTTITFNSRDAAEATLRSLGDNELRRRLALARAAAGGP